MVKVRYMERVAKCDKCGGKVLVGEPMIGWPARYGPAKFCRICGAKHLASVLVELASYPQRKPTLQQTLLKPKKCLNGTSSSEKSEKSSEQKSPCQAPSKGGKRKKVRSSAGNADI